MTKKHVMLAVDFSETSLLAVPVAKSLVQSLGADLTVVHAVAPGGARPSWIPGRTAPPPESLLHSDAQATKLKQLRDEHLSDLPDVTLQLVAGETAAEVIVDQARRMKSDFIVLSTHGRRRVSHVLMGSVAEGVVRHAHCPVIVVPAH